MIITLLSDLGYQDNFVGVAKGLLLRQLPDAQIIDLSHEVMPFHLLQCSYFLKSAYTHFPAQTVHLSLFDVMHQKPAILLLSEIDGQYIASADNSLLPLAFPNQLKDTYNAGFEAFSYLEWVGETALFLKEWENKNFEWDHLSPAKPLATALSLKPFVTENSLECQVIHVDKYGNVVMNLSREDFETYRKGRNFRIYFSRNEAISRVSIDYADVPEGEKLCLFNSGGFLELAVNKDSAAQLFGLSVMRDHQLIYQKIKIHFL